MHGTCTVCTLDTGSAALIHRYDVKVAYRWENGLTMVFGWDGEQIPELQAPYTPELHAAIRDRASEATRWEGFGPEGPVEWLPPAVRGRLDAGT